MNAHVALILGKNTPCHPPPGHAPEYLVQQLGTEYRTISEDKTHGKMGKTSENNIKRTRKVSKVTFVSEVRSHTVSVECTCTLYAECKSSTHKSYAQRSFVRMPAKCKMIMYSKCSLVTHTVPCARGNKRSSTHHSTPIVTLHRNSIVIRKSHTSNKSI